MLGLEFRVKFSCEKILAVETCTDGLTITYHCLGISILTNCSPIPRAKALCPKGKTAHPHPNQPPNQ